MTRSFVFYRFLRFGCFILLFTGAILFANAQRVDPYPSIGIGIESLRAGVHQAENWATEIVDENSDWKGLVEKAQLGRGVSITAPLPYLKIYGTEVILRWWGDALLFLPFPNSIHAYRFDPYYQELESPCGISTVGYIVCSGPFHVSEDGWSEAVIPQSLLAETHTISFGNLSAAPSQIESITVIDNTLRNSVFLATIGAAAMELLLFGFDQLRNRFPRKQKKKRKLSP